MISDWMSCGSFFWIELSSFFDRVNCLSFSRLNPRSLGDFLSVNFM